MCIKDNSKYFYPFSHNIPSKWNFKYLKRGCANGSPKRVYSLKGLSIGPNLNPKVLLDDLAVSKYLTKYAHTASDTLLSLSAREQEIVNSTILNWDSNQLSYTSKSTVSSSVIGWLLPK